MKSTPRTPKQARSEILHGTARYTFQNGDSYEGGYRVELNKRILVKQDEGVYATDNFEVYDGKWQNDKFADGECHIRYNNDAQYKGEMEAYGAMNGAGTYIFPDGSSLTATWSQNKPVSNVVYKQPLGHAWITTSVTDNHVKFVTGNHFWHELCET